MPRGGGGGPRRATGDAGPASPRAARRRRPRGADRGRGGRPSPARQRTRSRRASSGSRDATGRRRAASPPTSPPTSRGRRRSPSTPGRRRAPTRTSSAFRPHLEHVVELKRRYLECFEFDHPYDPLLDDFEPGMSTAELRPVLETLRDGLARLVAAIAASERRARLVVPARRVRPRGAGTARARRRSPELPLEPGSWRLDPDGAPVRDRDRRRRPADHDALRPDVRRQRAVDRRPRDRPRHLLQRDRPRARAHAAVRLLLARLRRVAVAAVGELGRPRHGPTCATSGRCSTATSRAASTPSTTRRSTGRRTGSSRR